MLIFLYGPDTFRISKKLEQIIEEYKKRAKGLDFSMIDAQVAGAVDFLKELRQTSLFQEKKFIVVKNPISNKDFKESLIDNMEMIVGSGHNLVFCQEGKVLKTDRLLSAFKKNAQVQEFILLEGEQLAAWIAARFKSLGGLVDMAVARALAVRIGSDLWRAENEIQKAVHYFLGRQISVADIEESVARADESNIFKTIDAVAARDKKTAIRLVRDHIGKGDHPLYLLAMIASQFRNLLLVKSNGQAGAGHLGIHPYVFSKTVQQARRFSLEDLQNIYRKVFQTDLDIKTGKISPEAGIDLLLASI
ncbi:MAG: DNA polymerase III subunit delta [Candidatus Paceibacterota bacterium]